LTVPLPVTRQTYMAYVKPKCQGKTTACERTLRGKRETCSSL